MKNSGDRPLYLLVFLLALATPVLSYSCVTVIDNGWTDGYTWMTCYQQNNGHVAGRVWGSLSQTWWGQSGDWSYNYNTIYYYHATNRARSWNCYYHNSGSCYTCCDGCCCGCGRNCYRYWWDGNYYRYDWQSNYYCDDSKTVAIYYPCHPYCASCNVQWNYDYCDSCTHNNHNAYKWLNWADTSYRRCLTYCPNRNYDNAYQGQYIANTGDLTCSWCNSTCSKC